MAITVLFVTSIPLAQAGRNPDPTTYLDPLLEAKAHTTPNALVNVIIQSSDGTPGAENAYQAAGNMDAYTSGESLNRRLRLVGSVSATMKAKRVLVLARRPGLTITSDARIKLDATPTSNQVWPTAEALRPFYPETDQYRSAMPSIAIVDSGIDKNRADFDGGARVVAEQVITQLQPNSPGDGRGHGTFVAGVAAGSGASYAGAAPAAKLVSLDVMDDNGMARTSDVIAAAGWIYDHKDQYNIRVANFSLHSTLPSNFTKDPLDKAVEKLWFSGVTVVAASGNYGHPDGPSGVLFAPGNDPFVITVGAVDLDGSVKVQNHDVPSWSAYGYTYDGFRKPEISAAGRYMVGPVPAGSTLLALKPENAVGNGYMRLSGTSFAAPVVSGAAAQILARNPNWTPDQVKGALMKAARYVREASPGSAGVGEVNAYKAANVNRPPNPNLALDAFLMPDPAGGGTPVFDAVSWSDEVEGDHSWDAVSWSDVSWSDVSWTDVSWSDVSWSDVSWSDVTWSDVLAIEAVTWEDAAEGEVDPPAGTPTVLTPEEEAAAEADPELGLTPDP
ncbi:MAG TPA: S8 family serine peptidase [Gaiellaceae bacterium]|nr:S8 family serine peptidase [Gaiellaceae bacterium]